MTIATSATEWLRTLEENATFAREARASTACCSSNPLHREETDLSALIPAESREDSIQLDHLIREFYRVICFEEGGAPDFERMTTLFSQHARITRITPEGVDHLDVAGFGALVRELLELGAFTSFYEYELGRTAHRYGDVFHIASAYETKASADAIDFLERGVNSLQILREQDGWRIVSLCWDSGSYHPDGGDLFN
jgi:hypothetical protein